MQRIERWSAELETAVLPLHYTPRKLVRPARVELASLGWKPKALSTKTKAAIGAD